MKSKLTCLILLYISSYSVWAGPVDYLCKVTGSYSDLDGNRGKINESISVTIAKTPSSVMVEIIGSEQAKQIFFGGKAGESSEQDSGIRVHFTRNSSSGSVISLEEMSTYKKNPSTFKNEFVFNTNTKVISAVYDVSAGANTLSHTSFSGTCK